MIRLAFELVVVAALLFKFVGEIEDMIEAKTLHGTYGSYFGVWNILDMTSILFYAICTMYWIVFFIQMQAVDIPKTEPLREAPPKGDPTGTIQALDWAHPDFLADLLDMTNNMMNAK